MIVRVLRVVRTLFSVINNVSAEIVGKKLNKRCFKIAEVIHKILKSIKQIKHLWNVFCFACTKYESVIYK